MRDSINYNLNYFIMRKSGTKPMKNTMRKQSPIRFMATNAAMSATKKVSDAVAAIKNKKTKGTGTTKGATTSGTYMDKKKETKPTTETSIKTGTIKSNPAGKPASNAETSVKSTTPPNKANTSTTETSVKSPTMQMKKSGMKKKC
jgi:hypothetical protein